jgi:hypothetical protein
MTDSSDDIEDITEEMQKRTNKQKRATENRRKPRKATARRSRSSRSRSSRSRSSRSRSIGRKGSSRSLVRQKENLEPIWNITEDDVPEISEVDSTACENVDFDIDVQFQGYVLDEYENVVGTKNPMLLNPQERTFIMENSNHLNVEWGGRWGNYGSAEHVGYERASQPQLQHNLTDRFFRNIALVRRNNGNGLMVTSDQKLTYVEPFDKLSDWKYNCAFIVNFLNQFPESKKEMRKFADYDLDCDNTLAFALIVFSARSILEVGKFNLQKSWSSIGCFVDMLDLKDFRLF